MKDNDWETIHFLESFELKNDSDLKLLLQISKKLNDSKNNLLKSEILTFITEYNIVNEDIIKYILNCLTDHSNYIVKLCAIDYIWKNKNELNENELKQFSEILYLLTNNRFRIIKNQVYLTLLMIEPNKKVAHLESLFSSLKRTDDYRSFVRIFNTIINYDLKNDINSMVVDTIIQIAEKKNFGLSVIDTIKQVKAYYDHNIVY